ncbi:MAG: RagB/SusD family nutrient uptake outer membrane protein [Bacteroides sp.]
MKNLKIYLLTTLLLTASACSDFLDKYPDTAVPEDEAMTDLTSSKEVVIGIYSSFKNPALYSGYLALGPDVQSDLVYAVKGYTNAYGNLYRGDFKDDNTQITDVYSGLYQIIARCNFFMDHRDAVYPTLITEKDKEVFKKSEGDVHFFRALAYSDLIRIYCEAYDPANAENQLGVSLYLHYRKNNEASSIEPRASLAASYQQVLDDLAVAEKYATRKGANTGYITIGAVQALKTRVYLHMQRWDDVIKSATEIVDSKIYTLADAIKQKWSDEATGNTMSDYQLMWKYDKGDEIIWRVDMSAYDKGGALGTIFLNYNNVKYLPDYVPAKWLLDSFSQNDNRYSAFFYSVKTGFPHGLTWPIVIKYLGNADIDAGVGKYYTNMPKVLRYSEVYLNRAEAYAQKGKTAEANADLTKLRRARITSYGMSSYAQDKLLEAIQIERAKELFMEGFRLSDLKRWHLGFERKPQLGTVDGPLNNALKVSKDDPNFTWPIPRHELNASMGIVKPNASNK